MSNPFREFVSQVLAPIAFSRDETRFFNELRSFSGQYTDFAKVLEKYPDKKFGFLEATNELLKSRLKEELTSTSAALSMVGYIPSRNFIIASIINKNMKDLSPTSPEIPKTLTYALKGEQLNPKLASHYFIAGLAFDMARISLSRLDPALFPPKLSFYLDDLWKHGVQVSQIACKLAPILAPEEPSLQPGLCVDGILHDIGKIFLFMFGGQEAAELRLTKRDLADTGWLEEEKNFPITHDGLGYLFLSQLSFVQEASWSALYHHQPFLAQRLGRNAHLRATLLWLADHMIRYKDHHKSSKRSDLIVEKWFAANQPAFKKCTFDQFKKAVSELGSLN